MELRKYHLPEEKQRIYLGSVVLDLGVVLVNQVDQVGRLKTVNTDCLGRSHIALLSRKSLNFVLRM